MRFLSIICLFLAPFSHADELDFIRDYRVTIEKLSEQEEPEFVRQEYWAKFESLQPTAVKIDSLRLYYFKRKQFKNDEKKQLTFVFPNMSPLPYLDVRLAEKFAQLGSNVIVFQSGVRMRNFFSKASDTDQFMKNQIVFGQNVLAWVLKDQTIAYDRIQVTGISMGGILAMQFLGLNPEVKKAACILGGAGYKGTTRVGLPAATKRLFQGRLREPSEGIFLDPVQFKDEFADRKVLQYKTYHDFFVPPPRQDALTEVLNEPKIVKLRGMHVPNALVAPSRLSAEIYEFFNQD